MRSDDEGKGVSLFIFSGLGVRFEIGFRVGAVPDRVCKAGGRFFRHGCIKFERGIYLLFRGRVVFDHLTAMCFAVLLTVTKTTNQNLYMA